MRHLTTTLQINSVKRLLVCLNFFSILAIGQSQTKKVLFLGNSYTGVNNLPKMVADVATSVGDVLIYDSNTPGGYYLGDHLINSPPSISKIKAGNWDYVVLQDQSLSHAIQEGFYLFSPATYKLDTMIKKYNPCAQTLFYITWGRKNGDSYFDNNTNTIESRTYYQMDSTIQLNYMLEADSLKASASPVGAVWRYIRRNYPTIELFDADGSHPSQAGTYAAACCFYSALFRKNPTLISFDAGLSAMDAANIRNAAKVTVYDNFLDWNIGKYDYLVNAACNTSIQNLSNNSVIKVFPNPFSSYTTLQTNTFYNNASIKLFNSFGQLIKQIENISGQTITLLRDNLPSGMYFLRLKGDNGYVSVGKLVINDN